MPIIHNGREIDKILLNGVEHELWYNGEKFFPEDKSSLLYLSYFDNVTISGTSFTDNPRITSPGFTPFTANISRFSFSVNTFSQSTANIPDSFVSKSVTYLKGSKNYTHGDYSDVINWTCPLTSSDVFSITWRAARVNRFVMDCIGFKLSANFKGYWSYGIWTSSWEAGSNGRMRFYGSSSDYDLYNGTDYYTDSTFGNGPRFPANVINNGSGVWNNYAIVSDGTGNIYVYVNGVLYLKKKSFTDVDLNKFFFGGVAPTSTANYGGMITELAVYSTDISTNNHMNVPVGDDVIS